MRGEVASVRESGWDPLWRKPRGKASEKRHFDVRRFFSELSARRRYARAFYLRMRSPSPRLIRARSARGGGRWKLNPTGTDSRLFCILFLSARVVRWIFGTRGSCVCTLVLASNSVLFNLVFEMFAGNFRYFLFSEVRLKASL